MQVKSSDTPVERVVLDQLIGTIQRFPTEQGLLISWGGFKQSVERERATQFFRVRLENRNDLIENLLAHYDTLDEDRQSELPLKRIWTITNPGEERWEASQHAMLASSEQLSNPQCIPSEKWQKH